MPCPYEFFRAGWSAGGLGRTRPRCPLCTVCTRWSDETGVQPSGRGFASYDHKVTQIRCNQEGQGT